MGRILILIVLGFALPLGFQNCGEMVANNKVAEVATQESVTENFGYESMISKIYTVPLEGNDIAHVFIANDPYAYVGAEPNLYAYFGDERYLSISPGDVPLSQFSAFNPFVVQQPSGETTIYFIDDNNRKIVRVDITSGSLKLVWSLDLPQIVEATDLHNMFIENGSLTIGANIINDIDTTIPNIELILNCGLNESIDPTTTTCVASQIACEVENGDGLKTWMGNLYGSCIATDCESGFQLQAGQCVVQCSAGESLNITNNTCVAQQVACPVDNGTGAKVWNMSVYSACSITSCNNGYKKQNNACVLDCPEDKHANGNVCVDNKIACDIANGSGEKVWNGSAYGACMAKSCYPGFAVSGGVCAVSCGENQHLFNGVCRDNVATCLIPNGMGEKVWDGTKYSACEYKSCNDGFGFFEGQCVADTQSCSIANGTGQKALDNGVWTDCRAVACNSGYKASEKKCVEGDSVTTADSTIQLASHIISNQLVIDAQSGVEKLFLKGNQEQFETSSIASTNRFSVASSASSFGPDALHPNCRWGWRFRGQPLPEIQQAILAGESPPPEFANCPYTTMNFTVFMDVRAPLQLLNGQIQVDGIILVRSGATLRMQGAQITSRFSTGTTLVIVSEGATLEVRGPGNSLDHILSYGSLSL